MEPRRDGIDLAAELRMLRSAPRQEFAAALDARAAAGFPSEPRRGDGLLAALLHDLRGALPDRPPAPSPRRLFVSAGAFALAAIVVATAVVAISTGIDETSHSPIAGAPQAAKGGQFSATLKPFSRETAPRLRAKESAAAGSATSGPSSGVASATGSSGIKYRDAPAITTDERLSQRPQETGPFASRAGHRDVERSSQIVLGADPLQLRADAAKVFETVHAYDGIVLRSSISDGAAGEAGATFDLLIPSGKLGDALATFSRIGEVRLRHESSQDITAPTVSLGEHLQDSRAKVEGLLAQLAAASSDGERAAVEAELRVERGHAAVLRSRLTALKRRANLSEVSLRIETGDASASGKNGSGSWGIGDALSDAGDILAVAAGVTLIGLAIIGPLVLIALLIWGGRRIWLKRGREHALN